MKSVSIFIKDANLVKFTARLGSLPERFNELEKKYADRFKGDDFLIKADFVRLKKN